MFFVKHGMLCRRFLAWCALESLQIEGDPNVEVDKNVFTGWHLKVMDVDLEKV